METYDYRSAVINDVREALAFYPILEGETREDYQERVYENLFVDDCVTGNGSGSYTFNAYDAEENICHNLELLAEACEEFGATCDLLKDGAEACDVTIRCYLLSEALAEVLDEMDFEED